MKTKRFPKIPQIVLIAYIDVFGLAIFGRIVRDLERRLTVGSGIGVKL